MATNSTQIIATPRNAWQWKVCSLCLGKHRRCKAAQTAENPSDNLAKVGVEGSNPFARSRFSQENQRLPGGPPGPFLLTRAWLVEFVSQKSPRGGVFGRVGSRALRPTAPGPTGANGGFAGYAVVQLSVAVYGPSAGSMALSARAWLAGPAAPCRPPGSRSLVRGAAAERRYPSVSRINRRAEAVDRERPTLFRRTLRRVALATRRQRLGSLKAAASSRLASA